MSEPKKTDPVELISGLAIKVEQLLQQADQAIQTLQQNLTKVSTQKIKLIAQKELLMDLKGVLTQPLETDKEGVKEETRPEPAEIIAVGPVVNKKIKSK